MTDGAPLLQAVLEAPDDDTARLVYADWLQEHGQDERAEFVRRDVVLTAAGSPDAEFVERSQHDLWVGQVLAAHADRGLCPPLAGVRWRVLYGRLVTTDRWPAGERLCFRRGFVEEVRCSAADWLTHGAAIMAREPVRLIDLRTFRVRVTPPGPGHGWQLQYFLPGWPSHFAMSGLLFAREAMVRQLALDVRTHEYEFG